jgi:hypothetical protein
VRLWQINRRTNSRTWMTRIRDDHTSFLNSCSDATKTLGQDLSFAFFFLPQLVLLASIGPTCFRLYNRWWNGKSSSIRNHRHLNDYKLDMGRSSQSVQNFIPRDVW